MKQWVRHKTLDEFQKADQVRSALLKEFPELKQGENIQIKYRDGAFQLRIAKDLVSEETRKTLNLK